MLSHSLVGLEAPGTRHAKPTITEGSAASSMCSCSTLEQLETEEAMTGEELSDAAEEDFAVDMISKLLECAVKRLFLDDVSKRTFFYGLYAEAI